MAWKIRIDDGAKRDLKKLGRVAEKRVLDFLVNKLDGQNPRYVGEPLKGSKLGHLWKYRIGDYRVIADIEDAVLHILIIRIGHRRDVYRK